MINEESKLVIITILTLAIVVLIYGCMSGILKEQRERNEDIRQAAREAASRSPISTYRDPGR